MIDASNKRRRLALASYLTVAVIIGAPSSGYATDATRIREIAAELNIPRRAWTICTVNEIGRAVQSGAAADASATADQALAACSHEEQALREKAVNLLGTDASERLMAKLMAEARDSLVGSARTLKAAKAGGGRIDPAWPRVLGPAP